VERCPRVEKVQDRLFEGEEAVLHVIERIVAPLGLRVDGSSLWVDARRSDGSRVQTNFLDTPLRAALTRADVEVEA
jgi:pilus assembly protein CpaF